METKKIKVVLGYGKFANVRYSNNWINSRPGIKLEMVAGTEDKDGTPLWAVDYSDLYNGVVHLYGLYSRMFLSALEQHIDDITEAVYIKVYGDYHASTKVTFKCNNKEYYRMNYNHTAKKVTTDRRKQFSIVFDKDSLGAYQFMDNGYDCTYHGYRYVKYDNCYAADVKSTEFTLHHDPDQLDDVITKKIRYNKILGLSDEVCAKSITKVDTIHVKHLRDAKTFNNQLTAIRSVLTCNAEKVELDSENSEVSLGYDHQIVVKYDRAKCYHVNIEMPEAYKPLIKNWLKQDDILHVTFTKDIKTKCECIDINEHTATALPGVLHNAEEDEDIDMVLDAYVNKYNEDRVITPKYKRVLNSSVYNFYPESKDESDPLRNYEVSREYVPSVSIPMDKWLKQFIAPEILESIRYKSDEDYNKDVVELLRYSIGVEDTTLVLKGKFDHCVKTITSAQVYLAELGYTGKLYCLLDKDQRLMGEGISKVGSDFDNEDNDVSGTLYIYQNDQDALYEMYEDNYTVINGSEYLVFEIK